MLARLIAHAPSRAESIAQLAAGLDATICWGVTTNRAFLANVLRDDAFCAGAVDTTFLARRFAADATRATPAPTWLEAIAAASLALLPRQPLPALWDGWSPAPSIDTVVPIEIDGAARRWRLVGTRASFTATCGEVTHRVIGLAQDRSDGDLFLAATVDGRAVRVAALLDAPLAHWQSEGAELAASTCACAARRESPSRRPA